MSERQTIIDYVWNNVDDIVIWQTTHRPYIKDGKPWGMEIEVAYNITRDKWVKITPASGSHYELITKEKADELMKNGFVTISEKLK